MSSLKVKQIKTKLLELFEKHLDLSDISLSDCEREAKVLSRSLAALALYTAAGCTEKEAATAVWDGTGDNGIDAAFFDPSEARVLLVQSKWINAGQGEPAAKDIATFANGVKDIVEQECENFHERLQERVAEISQAINSPGTTIEVLLISTGTSTISPHGLANLDRLLKELNGNDHDEPLATKKIMGLNEVYAGLASEKSNDGITLDANILEWSFIARPERAYFGIIDGLQLKNWWAAHGKRLITKNIRHALGATEVNNQIRATAIQDPEHFWYYNNGITLVANDSSKAPAGAASRSSGVFRF